MSISKYYLIVLVCALLMTSACSREDPELKLGEETYLQVCKVCHAQGINGAPVFGNKKNWAPRKEQGLATLVEHASNGFGLMPAKGGRSELTEAEITAAIKYMLAALEE